MADTNGESSDSSLGGKPTMKVPKFTGENFEIWEKKIWMVLAEFNLEHFIDEPPLPDMTRQTKPKAQKAVNLLCSNLSDGVFNTIVKKENSRNPYKLWQMFKSVYASDSILASYKVWAQWEDMQFNDDMGAYILGIEECLAKFDSLGMVVPDFVICCSIIGRITKKQPFLMQSLFGDLKSLGKPKTNKRKAPDSSHGATALTMEPLLKKKKPYTPITCPGNKHNPAAKHQEEDCWTLHLQKFQQHLDKQKEKKAKDVNRSGEANICPAFTFLSNTSEAKKRTTILDSGASNHMLTTLGYFKQTNPVNIGIVTGSGPGKLVATARGDAILPLANGGLILLKDALFVPNLTRNLISFV
ncbi:hypothetical protein PTTG_28426 [Puccinia triticina 1-1 BBBD Race 1]|uniref:Retrovirus-related Pol polyprotein from transposon TNT 1-94-like beta-barrel domain-containing protein n=1 Tax=Puccinia triticina (isolate 1-1 / race 1 (BBBD)) TaxID=630390 RepID=A0A180GCD1_PUCT1|nr:hypothetical protein PTTG_28426 [Puccinia triticina 1-1 BBBD Race 1]